MLTLLPGSPGSVLRCTLEKTFLINPTEYAALSYCWGDPNATTNIIVNNVEYPVTVNLADALHQLRSLNVMRVWADALCINQADEEEKGHQIRLMKHIYSRSELTYAWMGKDESGVCGDAIFFLQVVLLERTRLEDFPHSHPPLPPGQKPMFAADSTKHRRSLPNGCQRCLFEKDFRALTTFFGLEYWKRRWIIQEIAAASKVQVMCGNERITLHEMDTAISRCQTSCYWLREVESAYYYLEKVLDFRDRYQDNRKPLLSHAIKKSRNSLSTDARDKIFALLGICDDGAELVPEKLGYQYSAEVIVSNITKALIQKTGCLDLILINSIYKTQNRGALPTWTPDWLSHDISEAAHRLAESPRGMQQVLPPADLLIDSGILRVQGVSLGKILDITSSAQYEFISNDAGDYADRPISSVSSTPSYYRDSHDTSMALIRCLSGNIPAKADRESTATLVYALRAALGTEGFDFERNLDETDEHLTRSAQNAVATWVDTYRAFSIKEKSLKDWLETGTAFRFWIRICNSSFALALVFISLLAIVAAIYYSIVPFMKFIVKAKEHGLSEDASAALIIPFCIFWWPSILFSPLVPFGVVDSFARTANFVAVMIPHFEMGLADFLSSSRRLLVSDRGFLGTTYVAAEPGDEICFLVGCSSAVILRKRDGDTVSGDDLPPKFKVVGKVKVHLSLKDQYKYGRFQPGDDEYLENIFSVEYAEQGSLQEFDLI